MQMVTGWVACKGELPPVVESFKDGTNYHGAVLAWYPQFYKSNARNSTLFTHKNTGPRWQIVGAGETNELAPTHWLPLIPPPETSPV